MLLSRALYAMVSLFTVSMVYRICDLFSNKQNAWLLALIPAFSCVMPAFGIIENASAFLGLPLLLYGANVGVKGLGVMLSLDGLYNGPNSDLKADYRNGQWGGDYVSGSFSYNATPKYINVPAMLGLNYLYNINPQLGIYAEAGVGGNMRFITEMESVGTLNTFGIESSVKTTQKYDNAFSFAFQAGLGFEIAKNLRIGCSIYNLGKADVKGEETVKTTTLNDNISNTKTDYRTFGSIQPIMVLGRVGFSF